MTENKIFKLHPKADKDLANIYHYSIQEIYLQAFGKEKRKLVMQAWESEFDKTL